MHFTTGLQKNKEFAAVYEKGKSKADKFLVFYVLENNSSKNRIGVSVSKKVGNSVVRHRLKRLIKESYRCNEFKFKDGYDIVFIARKGAVDQSYKTIEHSLIHLASQMGVIS